VSIRLDDARPRTRRETVRQKADRYLLENRVTVLEAGKHGCAAQVRSEGAIYVTRYGFGGWTCSCPHPNRSTSCSHVLACKRVLAPDIPRRTR
jgi:hypothetical protein